MALVVNDRVKETSTTTGTGTFTLDGAVTGFETFSSAIGNTNTTYYAIVNTTDGEFEVGLGTVGAGTLARTTIISSSNSDSAVDFAAGTKNVFVTLPASKSVILDSSGNIVANNGSNLTNLDADNLASGTVPDARFPATLPAANGSALTALNATQLTSGTIPDARFPATLPALNGSALTDLDASNLASGTVPNARLDQQLQDVAGLAVTDGNFIVGDGSNFVAESGATARTSLGLGSIATLNTVTLTTNTTGDYVASLTAGALIDVGAAGEGATPSIAVDLSEATDMTETMVGTDEFIVLDAGSQKRKAAQEINLSIFNNDLPGDISGVTAGNGLTGGGTTGDVTLNVGAGTGIDVSADAIAVDVSDFMSNGVNNRLLTATGADAMNAEANLTFDGSTLTVTGTAAATTFSGSGASLTNIPNGALDNSAITINGTSTALGGSINVGDITGVTAGTLLDGGGTTGTVTLNVDLSELSTSTTDGDGDFFVVVDASNVQRKLTKANINNSGFNNDAGYTTNVGDITGVTAGSGLTGGGASGSVTLNVGAGTAIDVAADTVSVDLSELSTSTTNGDGDFFVVVDTSNAQRKLTKANIAISGFNNDSGFTTNTGTVTSVSGGNGLTGSVTTSGSLAVGAGTGIDVAADAISVDVSDFMSNGSNNRVLTATGTDAMNAEANMTFDGSTLTVTGDVVPGTTDTYDLGSTGNVWQNIYTGDLHLSNEAKEEGNAVDGTKGNWTIQEGENDLYILNNKSGKKYKFKLEEM